MSGFPAPASRALPVAWWLSLVLSGLPWLRPSPGPRVLRVQPQPPRGKAQGPQGVLLELHRPLLARDAHGLQETHVSLLLVAQRPPGLGSDAVQLGLEV